jgi:hypothetical protein
MVVVGTGAQKYVVKLVNYLLCDVVLYLPICKANFVFKYVGSSMKSFLRHSAGLC